jgi:hypothetical protein
MPTISQFFGVSVRMYYDDHPPPHFHAYYGDQAAKIDIFALEIQEGRLPRRVLQLVLEWAALHQNELMDNWLLAESHQELKAIPPLE